MTKLPRPLREKLYQVHTGIINLADFQQWLNEDDELKQYASPEAYHQLQSLDYKGDNIRYELWYTIADMIDFGEFETEKLLALLYEAKLKNENLPEILVKFYKLYVYHYYFLKDLGIGFGLSVDSPSIKHYEADTWHLLSKEQQKEILDGFSPQLEQSIDEAIDWIENKKIVLLGEHHGIGDYDYQDFRTEEEKITKVVPNPKKVQNLDIEKIQNLSKKKWWEFWK